MAAIYWFRKALRVHDNKLLLKACQESEELFAIFILDPQFTETPHARDNNSAKHNNSSSNSNTASNDSKHKNDEQKQEQQREDSRLVSLNNNTTIAGSGIGRPNANVFQFFFECLEDLDNTLQTKYNLKLYVFRGNPIEIFEFLFKNIPSLTNLYFENDTEPYAKQRDAKVLDLCKTYKIISNCDDFGHTLYNMEHTIAICDQFNKGIIPKTYRSFLTILDKLGTPNEPMHAPVAKDVAKNCKLGVWDDYIKNFEKKITKMTGEKQYHFNTPCIEEIGFKPIKKNEHSPFFGGETVGLERLRNWMVNEAKVIHFSKPQTKFNSIIADTTVLSPYITNGAVSVRLVWHEINKIYKKSRGRHTKPPCSLHGQLYFREWFYLLSFVTPNFHRIEKNPICRQTIEWDDFDAEKVLKWKNSETGYPLIDALMTQLRNEGWIHHLGRHLVACFLTRGDLWQSWEIGKIIFDELLLDGDYALNSANWMWLSCSAFFNSYWRVYSPVSFGKDNDPNGEYIRKYVPILKAFPKEYIYKPWMAPIGVQKKANCVIGKDYPFPMINHENARKENIEKMKQAFAMAKNNKDKLSSSKRTEQNISYKQYYLRFEYPFFLRFFEGGASISFSFSLLTVVLFPFATKNSFKVRFIFF